MLSNNCSILLIDDDADVLDAYTQLLEQAGYHVSACNNPFDAREQVPKDWPGIVLSDVCMPGCSGIDLMTLFHQDDDLLPILLITGHGDVPMAVEAVKKGAWDFLQKPIDPGKLLTLVDAALRQRQSVIARRQYCQQKLQVELIGRSQWTVRYRQRLQQLAETDIAVWLYGEPGTGRMTGARYLHQLGRHAEGPFIACELTPANAHTLNELIAQAQGGTLVLSHPEHLTHEQQHQLVQLQSHEKRPFRLIGIGSASLVELAASSQIVAELYYCFAMTQIGCQPLSKRPDDIEPLFHHYLQKTCQRLNHPVPEVDAGLLKGMMRRVWPNNVRELANAAELFAVGVLPLAETVNPLMHIGEPTPLDQRVEDVERQIITEALNIHQGRINEVAEYLLIPRKIDILIEVANLEELDSLNQAMEGVGYTVRGENGILNRRYFTKGGNQRSHHIHAFTTGDAQIIKHLAFRDYLIKHNDVAIQYALMKKSAMLLCENDSHRYSIYKADFIQKHLRMALIDAGHLG